MALFAFFLTTFVNESFETLFSAGKTQLKVQSGHKCVQNSAIICIANFNENDSVFE